jgi:DNA polymerase-1
LAKRFADEKNQVEIITGDKDFLQLAEKNILISLTKRGVSDMKTYSDIEVREEFEGLTPLQLIDLKGLMGDTSDNLPGIKGVGLKTATKLLKEYGTLENVLDNAENLKGALKDKVMNGKGDAILSKKLGTIIVEHEIEMKVTDLIINDMDEDGLRSFLTDLELFAAMNKVGV